MSYRLAGVIESDDGVPISNPIILFGGYQVLEVIQGRRKVCTSDFSKNWVYRPTTSTRVENNEIKTEYYPDPEKIYTYDEIKELAKGIDIVAYKTYSCKCEKKHVEITDSKKGYTLDELENLCFGPSYIGDFFKREDMKYAYALHKVCQGFNHDIKSEENDIRHTAVGILYSYEKRDICAWLAVKESSLHYAKDPKFIERYGKHKEWFEGIWNKANELIETYLNEEIPQSWIDRLETVFQYD